MAISSPSPRSQLAAIDVAAITDLREQLIAERAIQRRLGAEHGQTARALMGQRDVDSLLEREVAEDLAARARNAVADIDDAFARMDDGSYGHCEACGALIPHERLEVMPYARLCVPCSREGAARH